MVPSMSLQQGAQSEQLTWHTAAELVWELGNEVVINTIFQRTKNNNWPRILH